MIDPIFAAIERHRQLETEADIYVAAGVDIPDSLGDAVHDAYAEIIKTTPTTMAGVAALLRCIERKETIYGGGILSNWSDTVAIPARSLLSRLAATLAA